MEDRPPTPFQVAYLLYMKVLDAENMSRVQVEQAFNTLKCPTRNMGHDYNLSGEWYRDRGLLFPYQYPEEREQFLDRSLRGFVRTKVTHNSERLTKDKILVITRQFDAEDMYWASPTEPQRALLPAIAADLPWLLRRRSRIKHLRVTRRCSRHP